MLILPIGKNPQKHHERHCISEFKKRLLIDLDGVLNEYGKEKFDENCIPEIRASAKEFIEKLSNNYELYLFTTRNLLLASKWLQKYDIDKFFKDVTNVKLPAYLHIDDRALCFNGDYNSAFNNIEQFTVYWKN